MKVPARLRANQRALPKVKLPGGFFTAARRRGCLCTEDILLVQVAVQRVAWFRRVRGTGGSPTREYRLLRYCLASTSRYGIGQFAGSNRTPLGLHRVARKIGAGWPAGTVFHAREPVGYMWKGQPHARITTRILWLEGLEPGFNSGPGCDSFERYIYIHGTGDELTLGRPDSCGCVHLAARDLLAVFAGVPVGTLVWIGR